MDISEGLSGRYMETADATWLLLHNMTTLLLTTHVYRNQGRTRSRKEGRTVGTAIVAQRSNRNERATATTEGKVISPFPLLPLIPDP